MPDKKTVKTKEEKFLGRNPMGKAKEQYVEAVGRRKTSTARVRIHEASKASFIVNGKDAKDYFHTEDARRLIYDPVIKGVSTVLAGIKWNIEAKINGGGTHSQAEALRHGLSRAFVKFNISTRGKLKSLGFLKRDSRAKERRKFGLKKARKAPQWSKR